MKSKYILIILLIGTACYFIGGQLNKEVIYKVEEKRLVLDNLTEKVNELKGSLVRDLKQCESGGLKESDGLVTFDPHPTKKQVQIPSFGLYQFKKSTVQFYYKKFYNKDITGLEAINIALSEEKSSELASEIIFRDSALNNWYNCSKKLGLEGRLNIIKELQK